MIIDNVQISSSTEFYCYNILPLQNRSPYVCKPSSLLANPSNVAAPSPANATSQVRSRAGRKPSLVKKRKHKWKPYINADDNLTRLEKNPGVRFARNVPKRKNLLDVAERKVDVLMSAECTSKSQKGSEGQEGARTHDVRDQGPALWKVA